MISKGMILQYDAAQDTGVIMLSNGSKRTFTRTDLIDGTMPTIHQKVSYENDESPMKIKNLHENPMSRPTQVAPSTPKEKTLNSSTKEFTNVEDCISFFTKKGFKVIRDSQDKESRSLTLRSYSDGNFGEVMISATGSKINITQTLNGKPVV